MGPPWYRIGNPALGLAFLAASARPLVSITCFCPGAEFALKDGFRVDGAVTFVAESAQAAIASTAADVINEAATRFMKDPLWDGGGLPPFSGRRISSVMEPIRNET